MDKESYTTSTIAGESESTTPETDVSGKSVIELVVQDQSGTDLQALDEKVKSMMRKGRTMIPNGKRANGTPKRETSSIYIVCGKESLWNIIRNHIEANHLEGISIPCDNCGRRFSSRPGLRLHKSKHCMATRNMNKQ